MSVPQDPCDLADLRKRMMETVLRNQYRVSGRSNHDDAEDAVQDALLSTLRNTERKTFKFCSNEHGKSWLRSKARSCSISNWRHESTERKKRKAYLERTCGIPSDLKPDSSREELYERRLERINSSDPAQEC